MADLFALLVQSGNSLGAHSAALSTAGHNIANANTPGFSRQVVNLSANAAVGSLGSQAVGMGVSIESITRQRDLEHPLEIDHRRRVQARGDMMVRAEFLD